MPYVEVCNGGIKCEICNDIIDKDTVMIATTSSGYFCTYKRWHHLSCFAKAKDKRKPPTSNDLNWFNNLPDDHKKTVQEALWPNMVPLKDRCYLILPKNLYKMTCKDLKLELQKRNLSFKGKKAVLVERLNKFLEQMEYEKVNRMNYKDIQIQLKQRDLCCKGKKDELVKRLYLHLRNEKVEYSIFGYCRPIEQNHNYNMPTYLKKIIIKYLFVPLQESK